MGMTTTKEIAALLQSYFKNKMELKRNFGAKKDHIKNEQEKLVVVTDKQFEIKMLVDRKKRNLWTSSCREQHE